MSITDVIYSTRRTAMMLIADENENENENENGDADGIIQTKI